MPIKVIAKLQSHVARSFGYLVSKQRVLNQNTAILPCYSLIGSSHFTYARDRVSCFFLSNLHASLSFTSSLVGTQLHLTWHIVAQSDSFLGFGQFLTIPSNRHFVCAAEPDRPGRLPAAAQHPPCQRIHVSPLSPDRSNPPRIPKSPPLELCIDSALVIDFARSLARMLKC